MSRAPWRTVEADRCRHGNAKEMPRYRRSSTMVQEVCPALCGQPWDDLALAYLSAMHPTCVRVVKDGDLIRSDARCGRATVHLLADNLTIDRIDMELLVDLPEDVEHGHALSLLLLGAKDARR